MSAEHHVVEAREWRNAAEYGRSIEEYESALSSIAKVIQNLTVRNAELETVLEKVTDDLIERIGNDS